MPWCRNELACHNFLHQEGLKTNCLVFSGKFSRGFNRGVKNFTGFLREAKNLAPPYRFAVFGNLTPPRVQKIKAGSLNKIYG